ncbi:MAG: hypothetical protein IZT60_07425 [Gammaproteobacteria bacterium]|nr:hypothetical protein [Gammaproteobacteria bacterium]
MRQLFYLLMILNLLLFLWIYQTQQQPDQLQTGKPAIGDLRIVSDDVIQRIKSDVDEGHARAVNPDTVPALTKHASSRIIVTSINGYEVVLSSLNSYHAAVRIFDLLQPSAGVDADKSVGCRDKKCLFVADEEDLFNAGLFIERDSAIMQ